MTIEEYFGDWSCVIDINKVQEITKYLKECYSKTSCTPSLKDVFKTFELCPRRKCKVIFIGEGPYTDNSATGLAFANKNNVKNLKTSLKNLKNCVLDLEFPHNIRIFDPSLESISIQGALFLNVCLTTEVGKQAAHIDLWKPFIIDFIKRYCEIETGLIFVLFGSACSLRHYIGKYNDIIECEDLSTVKKLPNIFKTIDSRLMFLYGETIKWYQSI